MKKLLGFLLLCAVFVGLLFVLKSRLAEEARETETDASGARILDKLEEFFHNPSASEETRETGKSYADMTLRELVEAVADYRHLIDIYAASDFAAGLEDLKEECGAYAELVTRENWREALEEYGTELIEEYKETPREDGRTNFVSQTLQEIIDFVNGRTHTESAPGSDGGSSS